ncbi:MAG: hypothetical protein FJ041_04495 [Candidatus Cloacimonetes bacterium]|nr:hypothetical protein [Candidatus Cloacimonadota bacterium]
MSGNKSNIAQNQVGSNFTLVDLLTILLLVGLVFVFFVPVNQAKVNRNRVENAIEMIKYISAKAEEFKNNPENGYYPDLSQLNIDESVKSEFFMYKISPDDSLIIAETTQAFGKKGIELRYSLGGKQFQIGKNDSDNEARKFINENWLP